jgi:hypothetical protein
MFEYFNGYWDWASNNPNKVNPTSTAIYFYILSVANELHWKESFGLSSTQIMNGVKIATYKTYKKHFDELVDSGLLKVIEPSINQYKSNVIALVKFTKARPKQSIEQGVSTNQSTTHNHKTIKNVKEDIDNTAKADKSDFQKWTALEFAEDIKKHKQNYDKDMLLSFYEYWVEKDGNGKMLFQFKKTWQTNLRLARWSKNNSSSNLSFEKNKNGAAASPNTFSRASNGLQIK